MTALATMDAVRDFGDALGREIWADALVADLFGPAPVVTIQPGTLALETQTLETMASDLARTLATLPRGSRVAARVATLANQASARTLGMVA